MVFMPSSATSHLAAQFGCCTFIENVLSFLSCTIEWQQQNEQPRAHMSIDSILRRPILPIRPVEPHRNTLLTEDDLPPKVLSSLLPANWVNFYARSRNRSTALRNRRSVYLCTREYVSAVNAQSAEMSMRDRMNKTVGIAQSAEISMSARLNKLSDAEQAK